MWTYGRKWKKLLNSKRKNREYIMSSYERRYFKSLPDDFTIYRGYSHYRAIGWSWTLIKKKAIWFAKRFAHSEKDAPTVLTGSVKKADVIAYFSSRKEREIIVDAEKFVKVIGSEVLKIYDWD